MADTKKNFVRLLLIVGYWDKENKEGKKKNGVENSMAQTREERGVYYLLMRELELEDAASFTR